MNISKFCLPRTIVAIALSCAVATTASRARAYCRTATEGGDPLCSPAAGECCERGKPLYWAAQCVTYRVTRAGSERRQFSSEALADVVARAFARWAAPNRVCTPGFSAVELAPVDPLQTGDKINVIGARDNYWPYRDPNNVLAMTTLSYDTASGGIVEADLELNTANIDMRYPSSASSYSLERIVTHEVGHWLGIAHSDQPDALMAAQYVGEDLASDDVQLTEDDQRAICAIYPSRTVRNTAAGDIATLPCNLAALPPGQTCAAPLLTHGCSAAPARASSVAWPLVAVAALAGAARARRRRVTGSTDSRSG